MADNSVGMISLDLVIREKLGEQLEKIKARVSSPAEKIGEAVEEAIVKPMKNAGKAVADSVSKALETVDEEVRKVLEGAREDTSKAILEQLERTKKQQKELEETLNKPIKPRVVPAGPKFMPYDSSKITQEITDRLIFVGCVFCDMAIHVISDIPVSIKREISTKHDHAVS